MRAKRTRSTRVGAVACLLLALTATAGPAPAVAASAPAPAAVAPAPDGRSAQVLDIRSSAEGLSAPATARPGNVTFRVTTTDPASGWVSLVRPKPGVTFEEFRSSLLKIINHTAPDIIEGSAELRDRAELLGGTVIHPNLPASFSKTLTPGTYWFFDYQNIRNAQPRFATLTVGGAPATAPRPVPTASLTGRLVDGRPVWDLQGTVRAGRPLVFRNAMPAGQNIEAIFFRLAEDTTEEDLKAYIAEFGDHGKFPDHSGALDLAQGTGGLPMNSGESSVLNLTLQPGRYAVVDFFVDANDGTIFIKRGHWKIFEVR
ncbi:hypothetical protein [Streptomyces sp. NPDC004435]|uniref:hypothetical protein n=1 Tax=Streptomyces sp. NPDC004435 TaxID=3364701 RepID=UPI0036B6472F